MSYLVEKLRHITIFAVLLGAAFIALASITDVTMMEFEPKYLWVALAIVITVNFVWEKPLAGFCLQAFDVAADIGVSDDVVTFVLKVARWSVYGLCFIAVATLTPQVFRHASVWSVLLTSVLAGVCSALSDLIELRLFGKTA